MQIKIMAKSEIRKQLHAYIDMIEDESQLEMLHEEAETYVTQKQRDILDSLTPEQLKRLKESIKQAEEGKLIPHEEVIKISKQWLTK
jgi:predicted transcriptional regulator